MWRRAQSLLRPERETEASARELLASHDQRPVDRGTRLPKFFRTRMVSGLRRQRCGRAAARDAVSDDNTAGARPVPNRGSRPPSAKGRGGASAATGLTELSHIIDAITITTKSSERFLALLHAHRSRRLCRHAEMACGTLRSHLRLLRTTSVCSRADAGPCGTAARHDRLRSARQPRAVLPCLQHRESRQDNHGLAARQALTRREPDSIRRTSQPATGRDGARSGRSRRRGVGRAVIRPGLSVFRLIEPSGTGG